MIDHIQAVIFDIDGTLVDSMGVWHEIDVEYFQVIGVPMPPTIQKDIEGMSFSETAVYFKETFGIPDSLDEIKNTWNEMAFYKYTHEVPLKPGVYDFLKRLKEKGIRTGIATSNSKELAEAVVQSLHISGYMDEIHTSCEVAKGKPAPDIYLLVAECLEVKPEECLVFEDIPEGILAGVRAGMKTCAVEDDFSISMTEEKKELADYYITHYDEVR